MNSLSDLEKRAETVFGEATTKEVLVPTLDTSVLLAHESNPILKKRVLGKDAVDIAAMIKKLGNSDWVRQGLTFYEANDLVCPFCQQRTTDAFAASLADYVEETNIRISSKRKEIRDLEMQTTSIQPTIDGINTILSGFGFDSFRLAVGTDKKSYRLVRDNGEDARETLSEGEKSFVVFFYFYHLLRGSMSETGITADRIVVFDDPVSSLDSDILFVVSSLIRKVCDDVRLGRSNIKQVFVFTHNIYFHREVTFIERRKRGRLKEESFWIVRKLGPLSKVEQYDENPIRTSYELLWMDVRKPNSSN